jgi:biotin synthase
MKAENKELIDQLYQKQILSKEGFMKLIDQRDEETAAYLFAKARTVQKQIFGNTVYIRGIVEFSSYCRSNCLYCGIRRDNRKAERYRLSEEDILACCRQGHAFGFRTFVLQSGEDLFYTDEMLCHLIRSIKQEMPDSAITLSIGEKKREQYQKYYDAGADRYLLRHETASPSLYAKLHPSDQTLANRMRCLQDLKEIGYQVGAGMMIQSPGQHTEDLVTDLYYLKDLQPDMIGIGPFIPHHDTPFCAEPAGSAELSLYMIGILRLMFPNALLPATTALGTIDQKGREKGILAGANVIMPNLSPKAVRGKYLLYNNKICTGEDASLCSACISNRMRSIGYQTVISRGDAPGKMPHSANVKQ